MQFCLAGDGWGTAAYEDEASVLKLVLNRADAAVSYRFEAETFEEALQKAVLAGILKANSVQKQIAFVTRGAGDQESSPGDGGPTAVDSILFSSITGGISALVHETQRERGISSLYTSSGGQVFGAELREQWRRTDKKWRELLLLRTKLSDRLPMAIRHQLDGAEGLLATVVAARGRVRSGDALPMDLISVYSGLNTEILRIIDELSSRIADPLQRPTVLAWMALLHAKEKTGIERAQLASAFARDRFFEGQHLAVASVIAGRQCYLHLFAAAAPGIATKQLREELGPEITEGVERMEKVALDRENGGFGVDATVWFAAMSRFVETLGHVEAALRLNLTRT